MADENDSGQFGNRPDTEKQASEGGHASSGRFGQEHGADPHAAGGKGAQAEPTEAKAAGR